MHQKIDKKFNFFFYIIVIFFLSSIHNIELKQLNFFKIKKIYVNSEDSKLNFIVKNNYKDLIGQNIFFLEKTSFSILDDMNNIHEYSVKKRFPNKISIEIVPTKPIANVIRPEKNFFIGNNGKKIKPSSKQENLLKVYGSNNTGKIFQTLGMIQKSEIEFSNIKSIKFYPSERIDIILKKNLKIKYPINLDLKILNLSNKILEDDKFKNAKEIDLRVKNQIIKK